MKNLAKHINESFNVNEEKVDGREMAHYLDKHQFADKVKNIGEFKIDQEYCMVDHGLNQWVAWRLSTVKRGKFHFVTVAEHDKTATDYMEQHLRDEMANGLVYHRQDL